MVYGGTNFSSSVLDELADVQAGSIDMDCNVMEMADILNESMERTYNDLFKSVALDELAAFSESGQIVIYEEGTLESFKNKIIDWFKKVWANIKKAYDTFLDKMDKMAKEFKKKMLEIAGGKDNAKEALEKFEDGKIYYKNYDFGKPDDDVDFSSAFSNLNLVKAAEELSKVRKTYEDALKGNDLNSKVDAEKNSKTAMKAYAYFGMDDPATSDVRKKVFNHMIKGSSNGKNHGYSGGWIKQNYKGIVSYVTEFGVVKRQIKRAYAEDKNTINKMIAEVKKSNKEEPTKLFVTYAKKLISINNGVKSANLQYITMKYNCYRAIVMRVISARVLKPKPTKESATVGSCTSQVDMVSELFKRW